MRAAASLFAALLLAAASAASAADLTWTYTASMSTTNGLTDGGITVTPTYEWAGNAYFGTSSGLLQIGKTSHNVLSVTYAFSAFPSKVKSIAVTGKTASGNSGNTMVSASVGGEEFAGSASLTNGVGTVFLFAPDGPQTGTVSLRINNPKAGTNNGSSQAVYLSSIVVTYDNPEPDDPWKPEWTVGAPSPVPTIGKAFSFGVSAALSDGTPQTVAFGGLSPAATGAQFVDGVFFWTPGADAAGDYAAAFSVQNDGGTYSTNVAFTVRGATEEVVVFFEPFSGSANNTTSWAGTGEVIQQNGDFVPNVATNAGWTGTSGIFKAPSAIRFGNKTTRSGTATTPAISLLNGATYGSVELSFHAATKNAGNKMVVTVLDMNGNSIGDSLTINLKTLNTGSSSLDEDGYTVDSTGSALLFARSVPSPFRLHFAPAQTDSDIFLDSVKVTQTVSTSLVDLDVPTGLAVVDGTLSTNAFSVAWNGVASATNYTVEVREAGVTEAVAAKRLASPPAAFTGLADDMVYEVRVRAEGDTSLYNFSAWTNLSVRTARSAAHATLSFGPWINAAGDGLLYAGITNAAAVSAVRDNGTNAVVTFTGVSPEPTLGPEFENGVLAWTPDDADTNKTFTVSFLLDGTYATNLSFKVRSVPFLQAPEAEAVDVAWNSFGLSWNRQLRAAGYAVRAWTDCPNPNATATRIEEDFAGYAAGVRPADWVFHCATGSSGFYKDDKAPVKLSESTHDLETYDLGGAISSVSFHAAGHSISNSTSTLTVVGIAADNTETVLATLSYSDIGQTGAGIDRTLSIPAGTDVRRIAWRYTKDKGGIGVGSVVIEGTGFSTPRWLPGWGPAAKDVGLVQACTVAKPRPGKALGVDPADKTKDLEAPRINYAEVTVRNAAGATLATVVAVKVPAPPRSARATLMILK